jgi:hypothetical protein
VAAYLAENPVREDPAMAFVRDSKWATLLRNGISEEFNRLAASEHPDLRNTDLRMVDLRKADLSRADLGGAYLRQADLRGLDLSMANLNGASMHGANVAGALFPVELPPEEIYLSVTLGTRIRYR